MYKRKPVKGELSRLLVKFCISFLVAYTVINCVLFYIFKEEPATLTTCVFAAFSGELLFLCLKRIFAKADGEKNENTNEFGGEL